MRNIVISKEKLTSLSFNEDKGELEINWWTGGEENAVCGITLKVELVTKLISNYKSPHIPYDPDYSEAF